MPSHAFSIVRIVKVNFTALFTYDRTFDYFFFKSKPYDYTPHFVIKIRRESASKCLTLSKKCDLKILLN